MYINLKKIIQYCLLILAMAGITSTAVAQQTDKKLKKKLIELIADFQGDIGIYVKDMRSNKEVSIQGDSLFPTASIIKIPILVGIFNQIEKGNLKLDQTFIYRSSQQYGGAGLMQFFQDSTATDLATMVSLMISYSDNVASIWCQNLAGGGVEINRLMDQYGFPKTKVNSKTEGRQALWEQYGWGQTSPKEIALLVEKIRKGEIINTKQSDQMYRVLGNIFYNGRSLSQLPSYINTASKTGSVDAARGEVVLVNAPQGDYVFSVLTNNNKDQSWTDQNEAEVLTRKISKLLWEYYQ